MELEIADVTKFVDFLQELDFVERFALASFIFSIDLPKHFVDCKCAICHFPFCFAANIGTQSHNGVIGLNFLTKITDGSGFAGGLEIGVEEESGAIALDLLPRSFQELAIVFACIETA